MRFFSCRSANLPENTSKISRGIQWKISKISRGIHWKISRQSLEHIENIKAFNGKYKGNLMESENKGGAAAPPLLWKSIRFPLYFPLNALIFSIFSSECLDIFHWMPRDIFDVFSGRFALLHEKSASFIKNAHLFNALFWINFHWGVKMVENHEKTCFTFFAFLPSYIGVSGSLVSRNG